MKNCAAVDMAGLGWEGENCGRKPLAVGATLARDVHDGT